MDITHLAKFIPGITLALIVVSSQVSAQEDRIRANIRGGSGDGKCTFEVEIDEVAEVEIRGDQGYLRTISGSPARWRRLDCNQALPYSPNNFKFQGVDGRGRQELLRDPNSNQGVAVIRLEDPKQGREGYTGDIMWRGGSNEPSNSGGSGGFFGPGPGSRPNRKVVSCSSDNGDRRYCDAETRAGVRLVRQFSSVPCEKDRTWGFDDRGIWVDRGCGGEFALEAGPEPSGGRCIDSVGDAEARRLADQCRQVSPATRPPCNVENSCSLIIDEIKRGCGILGRDAPRFCSLYR